MQTRLSDAAYLDALDRSTAQVGALARGLAADQPVASCPGWRVRDLLEHLGGVHTWARRVIAGGNPKEPKPLMAGDPVEWYTAQSSEMITAMRRAHPQQQVWSFRAGEQTAGFWFRRQAHETEMHLVDLALTAGIAEDHLPALASDGVSEIFEVMMPRVNREAPVAIVAPILLSATDDGNRWLLRPSELPATVDYTLLDAADTADAAVRAAAPAHALLTGLWRRTPYGDWAIAGDRSILDRLMTSSLTP